MSTCASLPAPLLSQQKVSLSWPREAGTGFGEGVMEVIFDGGGGQNIGWTRLRRGLEPVSIIGQILTPTASLLCTRLLASVAVI